MTRFYVLIKLKKATETKIGKIIDKKLNKTNNINISLLITSKII